MRPDQFGIVLRLAVVVAVLLTCGFAVGTPPHVPAFGVAAQDASAVEAGLGLDRATRRLIQQGLRNEGFDPGAPDGLFGPRTREAISRWQQARGVPATGYLDKEQAELLRASRTLPAGSESVDAPIPAVVEPSAASAAVVSDAPPLLRTDDAAPASAPGADSPDAPTQSPRQAEATESPAGLPPEILVDRHLVRVERLLADEDYRAAQDMMTQIIALQRDYDVALPAEFPFKFAQVAFAAGRAETALEHVNEYLLAAGRDGRFYREALELLDSAENAVRQADAERRRAEAAWQRAEEERRRTEALQRENDELARRQVELAAVPRPRDPLHTGGLAPEMVTLAAGRFQYHATIAPSPGGRARRSSLEWVVFDRPFAIGKYEVTRGEFELFVDRARYRTEARRDPEYGCDTLRTHGSEGRFSQNTSRRWNRPGIDQTDRHPVTCVSVRDAVAYARWLSQETGHS